MAFKIRFKLQTKIILLVVLVVTVALVVANLLIVPYVEADIQNGVARQAISVARLVARSPVVVDALVNGEDNTDVVQKYTNESAETTGVLFVVVLDMNGVRLTHPIPGKIGERFATGDEVDAMIGKEYISTEHGSLGYSLRAFTPVLTPDGNQIGVVVVGVLMDEVQLLIEKTSSVMNFATMVGMLVGIIGAFILSESIKKTLFGLEPEAIAKRLEERNAMLYSVCEGIIAVNSNGIITLVNPEALRILSLVGLDDNPVGKFVNDYLPNTRMMEVIHSGKAELNQEHDFWGLLVVTNRLPIVVEGKIVGAIATFRDKTEVKGLAEELTGVRDYVDALRAQAHEFMNQLHVILGLVKLESYDQLASYINQIATKFEAEVSFVSKRIKEPVLAGFILSKLSLAREQDVLMNLSAESYVPQSENEEITHELVTIIGNLVENAFDAVREMQYKEVEVHLYCEDEYLYINVSDTGKGILPEMSDTIFEKGISSKDGNRGYGLHLVKCSLERLQGSIEFETRVGEGTEFIVKVPYEVKGNEDD